MAGDLEVSAVSIHAFPEISDDYALMNCGASMGEGYGPMIVAKRGITEDDAMAGPIAVPGLKTSAYLGLRMAWGEVEVTVVPFDEIIPRILADEFTSGLIIHEGQLTYGDFDLEVLLDLGIWWGELTGGLPMPLGGNVVRRDLGGELMKQITLDTKRSIEHALKSPAKALEFAKQWGRGIDDSTNERFVGMYVNQRTIDYGEDGRRSVRMFLAEGQKIGLIDADFAVDEIEFIGLGD
jgi:1,4-dihydroxy-6-naphthoate synthase